MRGVQEPVGHLILAMTQQYSQLTPAALDATIRLLETARSRGRVETVWRRRKPRPSNSKQLKGMNVMRGRDLRWKLCTRKSQ